MMRCLFFLSLVLLWIAPVAGQDVDTLRVYFVGNSVTDTINYRALGELAESRGRKQVWGRHMIPGAPLQWIWEHPRDGFQQPPFGHYPAALTQHPWDVLCLQPFDRHLEGDNGDLAMAKYGRDPPEQYRLVHRRLHVLRHALQGRPAGVAA